MGCMDSMERAVHGVLQIRLAGQRHNLPHLNIQLDVGWYHDVPVPKRT